MSINANETRIKKLADYLKEQISDILNKNANEINANMLGKNIGNFSLDKIPTTSIVERWITGDEIHRDVYSFRSRNEYSTDAMNNLKNIGFFEQFESKIYSNNEQGELPEIDNIESIKCLNCGTVNNINTNTCEMNIQIQITYRN